jgi:hypothetical protein
LASEFIFGFQRLVWVAYSADPYAVFVFAGDLFLQKIGGVDLDVDKISQGSLCLGSFHKTRIAVGALMLAARIGVDHVWEIFEIERMVLA